MGFAFPNEQMPCADATRSAALPTERSTFDRSLPSASVVPVVVSSTARRHSIDWNVGPGATPAHPAGRVVVVVDGTADVVEGPSVVAETSVDDDPPGTVDVLVVVGTRVVLPPVAVVDVLVVPGTRVVLAPPAVVDDVLLVLVEVVVGGAVSAAKRLTEFPERAVV